MRMRGRPKYLPSKSTIVSSKPPMRAALRTVAGRTPGRELRRRRGEGAELGRARALGFVPNEPWVPASGRLSWRPPRAAAVAAAEADDSLSESSTASMDEVSERLTRYWSTERAFGRGTPEPLAPRRASVLVPLVTGPRGEGAEDAGVITNDVRVLLCTRTATLSTHAGEVCLPGGKNDAGESDREAALREAEEEVGVRPTDVSVLAELPPFLSKGFVSVRPVVARVADTFQPRPNPDEVDECFTVPLASFLDLEGYSYRDWEFVPGRHIRVHYFRREGRTVWGLTAAMLIRAAEIAFGREAPFAMQPPIPGGTDIQSIRTDARGREDGDGGGDSSESSRSKL